MREGTRGTLLAASCVLLHWRLGTLTPACRPLVRRPRCAARCCAALAWSNPPSAPRCFSLLTPALLAERQHYRLASSPPHRLAALGPLCG